MKNILFYLSRYPGYGGIERVTTVLCNAFIKDTSYNIYIVSKEQQDANILLGQLDKRIKFIQLNGIKSLSSLIQEKQIGTVVYQDSFGTDYSFIEQSTKNLEVKKIVVVHNTPNAFELTLNCEVDGNWTIRNKLRRLKTNLDVVKRTKSLFCWADKYVLLSDAYKPILKNIIGSYQKQKIVVINNPVTIDLPSEKLEKKYRICLFLGRLHQQKGILLLMDIWEQVERRHPDWKLKIVGDGPERCFVEKFIVDKGLRSVCLEGFQTDVARFYRESSIFLMTSIFEGWPLTLFEAMAYGCVPVMFDSFAAAREIVDNKKNGFLISPFDKVSFASALNDLMENDSLIENMANETRHKIELFSVERIVEQWKELF